MHDRNEEELLGYRDALKLIHEKGSRLPIAEKTILDLHRLSRGDIWDAGVYKEQNGDIIEKPPDGSQRLRFKTVTAAQTSWFMSELLHLWNQCLQEKWLPPLIALAAFNLDFLCIHPFRDGNGRVSRLLLLLQCYHLGYEVGRYISLERLIEQNKERYYETLEQSSTGWNQGKHNPWPFSHFVLYTLKTAYTEFEERLGKIPVIRGEKTALVVPAIEHAPDIFRITDVRKACPGVSLDMIRKIIKKLRSEGRLESLGRGQNAQWQRIRKVN